MAALHRLMSAAIAAVVVSASSVAAAPPNSDSLLWRVETEGSAAPSYVFGTMHSDRKEILDLPADVERAFDDAERYAFEIDFSGGYMQKATQSMLDSSGGPPLKEQLKDGKWRQLKEVASERGIPAQSLDQFETWAVAVMLSIPETKPRQTLDRVLQRQARENGAPVEGLETVEEQLSVFSDLPEDKQIGVLETVIDLRSDGRLGQLHEESAQAYLDEDLARLVELMEQNPMMPDPQAQAEFKRRMITERNTRMVKRMQPQLDKGGAFVAIGALHLPGEEGIIQQLQNAGYEVTAVE